MITSSVYWIFTKLDHMIALWKRKNPSYFGVIRSKVTVTINRISMPTGFFIWGYMYPFTFIFRGTSKFMGVQCTPLTLHLGVQRKLTAFSPRKVVHHTGFCKYYAELAKTFFFCLTLGVGFSLTHGLCVCLTIFL
jgi:hypothetical protein